MSELTDRQLRELLIRDPKAGWRAFVDQYTPTLLSLIERAGMSDHDEAIELYILACERLSADDCAPLRRHDPAKDPLSSWLSVVMRTVLVECVRSLAKRRRLMKIVEALPALEQQVFELFYWNDRTPAEICSLAEAKLRRPVALSEVMDALDRLEGVLTETHRRELLALSARSRPPVSLDPELEPVVTETVDPHSRPEQALRAGELARAFDDALATLRPEDAAILRLKYEQGLSNRDIQRALHLERLADDRVKTVAAGIRPFLGGTSPQDRSPAGARGAWGRLDQLTHLTPEELLSWRDQPEAAHRDRVVRHLASCNECAALCAELIRTRPAELVPSRFAPADFASRGYGVHRRGLGGARLGTLVPLAAAALLAIVILVPLLQDSEDQGVPGGGIEIVAPTGEVRGPLEFSWRSATPAYQFRVNVKDENGGEVLSRSSTAPRIPPSADISVRFAPGKRYMWTVTALDRTGEAIGLSDPASFTIARTP